MIRFEDIPDFNKLNSRIFFEDIDDWMRVTNPSKDVSFIRDIAEVENIVNEMLLEHGKLVYTTGGWQGTLAQIQTLHHAVGMPILLGLEQDSYIRKKGREPLKSLDERIKIWTHIMYPGSRIFIVPENLEGEDYDLLAQRLGFLQRENVYFLGNRDDSPEIKSARQARCFSNDCYLEIYYGNTHTSDYLE